MPYVYVCGLCGQRIGNLVDERFIMVYYNLSVPACANHGGTEFEVDGDLNQKVYLEKLEEETDYNAF